MFQNSVKFGRMQAPFAPPLHPVASRVNVKDSSIKSDNEVKWGEIDGVWKSEER
jgi:hypothetical protein